jgi:hypothetical protein
MDQVLERITAWEAAGLIDPATAARLRLAEAERAPEPAASSDTPTAPATESPHRRGSSSLASIFGPGVTIGEMFAYLGGAFLLGAFEAFVIRLAGSGNRSELPIAAGSLVAALALGAVGRTLMNGDPRRRRAAGVMFALAVAHVGAFGAAVAAASGILGPLVWVIGGLFATVAAVGLRLLHPSMLTQVALLSSATSLAAALLSWLEAIVVPEETFDRVGEFIPQAGPNPILLVLFSAVWWLGLAVLVGIIGLYEADAADQDPSAGRRASLTRLWAGLIAVIGLATAITRSDYTSTGEFHRVIEPFVGDLVILVLAAVLVERAFRREASTYVYAAALGLMIALSDFNFSYLTSSAELGLLVEGLILLAAGVAADRLRRRLGRPPEGSAAPEAPAAAA